MMDSAIRYEPTHYGFNYGAAEVTRVASDEKLGWVYIGVVSPKGQATIYVTRTGKIRIYLDGKELT